jgi:membrane fusion protein (multidrug efflux system)
MDKAGPQADRNGGREPWFKRWRWPLLVGGPALIIAIAIISVVLSGRTETTDNAYVQIAKAPVAASIPGRVVEVFVAENQYVKAGQPLFRLDARDLDVGQAQAEAQLAQAELQVRSLKATYDQETANASAAAEALRFRTKEAQRQQALVAAGVSSRQQADEARHDMEVARDQLAAAHQQAAAALANLGGAPGAPVSAHPSVLAARARLNQARLNQSYSIVTAPTDGVVTRVEQLQPGAYIQPSQTLFWLLRGRPWVEANFKESQLAKMKIGQSVAIHVDAAPDADLKGHVASFSPGTGAIFSALPAQNATGNWVKVTQRLPVRIDFDGPIPEIAGRAGLSAHVKVNVREPGRATGA